MWSAFGQHTLNSTRGGAAKGTCRCLPTIRGASALPFPILSSFLDDIIKTLALFFSLSLSMELSISAIFVPLAHHRHSTNSLHFRSIHQHFRTLNSQNFGLRRSQSSPKAEYQRLYTWAVRAAMADKVSVNGSSSPVLTKPADVVREFYASVNRRNLKDVQDLIAENCVYEDLVYPKPFVGRQAIIAFFKKFMDLLSYDLQFVIDDISKDDSAVVGVAWHLAWRGKSFPFSKGCSFYRCDVFDGKMQILYGRDAVEPAFKPGNFALAAIKAVTTLLERFPWLSEKF